MKQSVVFCTQPIHGTLYFYVLTGREEHYLFGQSFRPSLWKRYRYGVLLDSALDWSKCGFPPERKVREKLFKMIPYIEKEYGLSLLRKSEKSSRRRRREDEPSDRLDRLDRPDWLDRADRDDRTAA